MNTATRLDVRLNTNYDFLKEYDEAPEDKKYPLVQKWMRETPIPFFAQLRAERPVLKTPVCTLVANFVDVRDMLQMPRVATVDLYKPKMGVTGPDDGYLMAHDDDALHYREKSIMQGLLNRNDLPRVRSLIGDAAQKILKKANGSIEFVNEYCRKVPVSLVQSYFGLDGIDQDDLIRWSYWNQYDAFNNQPFDMRTDTDSAIIVEKHDQASTELVAYIASLTIRKILRIKIMDAIWLFLSPLQKLVYRILGMAIPERHETMVMRLYRTKFDKGVDFPLSRAALNAGGFLIGAIETTSQAVAQIVHFLLHRPEEMRKIKDAAREGDRETFNAMVWEALRFVPIRPDIFRKMAEDYVVGKSTDYETTIEKGEIVRLLIHSAMFDERAYENPEAFDPKRTFYHNFAFGFGEHECLGKYVGMEMIPEMVWHTVLLPDLKADSDLSYRNATFPDFDGPFPENFQVSWG